MNDYSNLIVIGYAAGYGGEFFHSLLASNYTNYKPILRESNHLNNSDLNNWYTVDNYNSLGYLKCLDSVVDHCGDLITGENKTQTSVASVNGKKYMSLIWEKDPLLLIENLIYFCRQQYDTNKPKIINFHYHERLRHHNLFPNLTMNNIFPNSKKIRLVGDKYYHDLFSLLYLFKTNAITVNKKIGNTNLDFFIDGALPKRRKEFIGKPFEDFVDVDVGKLFFEDDKNIILTEALLSEITGTNIAINKHDILKKYKHKNLLILKNILGNDFLKNSEERNTELVFNYVKREFGKPH